MRHDDDHEPDPAFLDHLEWQIGTALRRRGRFARPVPGGAVRAVRTLAIVLVSLFGGAGAVLAAEHLQDARERELALARTRLELEMAEARLELVARESERVEALVANGVAGPQEARESRTRVAQAEREVRRLRLEREEIGLSGLPPRDALSAPRVAGRDFVAERAELEREALQAELEQRDAGLSEVRALVERGFVTQLELVERESALARVDGRVRLILERMKLRRAFLTGALSAEEVELHGRRLELDLEQSDMRREREVLARGLERTEKLELAGQVPSGEADELRLELRLLDGRLELLRLERALVAERLGESPPERGTEPRGGDRR